MDYKQECVNYQEFGNFNFGATGAAQGIPDSVLLRGAGWAQIKSGTSQTEWGDSSLLFEITGLPILNPWGGKSPFGDDPYDQEMILQGIQFYRYYMH